MHLVVGLGRPLDLPPPGHLNQNGSHGDRQENARIRRRNRRAAERQVNNSVTKMICPVCGKILLNPQTFSNHVKIHDEKAQKKCDECDYQGNARNCGLIKPKYMVIKNVLRN